MNWAITLPAPRLGEADLRGNPGTARAAPRGMTTCLGASVPDANHCRFLVWAPHSKCVELVLLSPRRKVVAMRRRDHGYHQAMVEGVKPGARYLYRLDGNQELPDPASRFQPDGVHGPSAVANPAFAWRDRRWAGVPLCDYILYELHVGTFTPEGTLMPLSGIFLTQETGHHGPRTHAGAQFPGNRNWGYDGVYPYAVQNSYGGPAGLKGLVNAAHRVGLAVVLDVVYNHLGPEGNHLASMALTSPMRTTHPGGGG